MCIIARWISHSLCTLSSITIHCTHIHPHSLAFAFVVASVLFGSHRSIFFSYYCSLKDFDRLACTFFYITIVIFAKGYCSLVWLPVLIVCMLLDTNPIALHSNVCRRKDKRARSSIQRLKKCSIFDYGSSKNWEKSVRKVLHIWLHISATESRYTTGSSSARSLHEPLSNIAF